MNDTDHLSDDLSDQPSDKLSGAQLSSLLRESSTNTDRPLHPENAADAMPEQIDAATAPLTHAPKARKKKKPGRKPSGNKTLQLRVKNTSLQRLDSHIARLNAKGLGLDRREVINLLIDHTSALDPKAFQTLIIAQRSKSSQPANGAC